MWVCSTAFFASSTRLSRVDDIIKEPSDATTDLAPRAAAYALAFVSNSQAKQEEEDESSDAEPQPEPATPISSTQPPPSRWFDQVNSSITGACSSALNAVKQQPALAASISAGVLAAAAALGVVIAAGKRRGGSQKSRGRQAAVRGGDASAVANNENSKGGKKSATAPSKPGQIDIHQECVTVNRWQCDCNGHCSHGLKPLCCITILADARSCEGACN